MASKIVSKDLPLQGITLRKYEEPAKLKKRELAKKFLLSIGLLQPGESRDIIVDIFVALLQARKKKKTLDVSTIIQKIPNKAGISEPNVRRQLRRLKDLKLIEKSGEGYRITEFGQIQPIINDFVIQFLINPSVERLKQYAEAIDQF